MSNRAKKVAVRFVAPTPETADPPSQLLIPPIIGEAPRARMDCSSRDPQDGSASIPYTGVNNVDLGFVIGLGGSN